MPWRNWDLFHKKFLGLVLKYCHENKKKDNLYTYIEQIT